MFLVVGDEVFGTRLDTDTLDPSDGFERAFTIEVRVRAKAEYVCSGE